MPNEAKEIRSLGNPADVQDADGGVRVSGYAAVFNQEADIGGFFREVIAPGAFTDAIGRDDVVFLINHGGLPLARTRSGTLKLEQDAHGLRMETVLDADDPDVKSIIGKMKRGDLDKMSFAFHPEIEEWDDTKDPPLRTIKKAKLADVAIVTSPAYDGTEIGLRSLDAHRQERQSVTNAAAAKLRIWRKKHLVRLDERKT